MKKFLALLLAALLICSLGSAAFAEGEPVTPPTNGSITVRNAVPGETYKLYKIMSMRQKKMLQQVR